MIYPLKDCTSYLYMYLVISFYYIHLHKIGQAIQLVLIALLYVSISTVMLTSSKQIGAISPSSASFIYCTSNGDLRS